MIKKEHLAFLDFMLPILNEKYPNHGILDYLADNFKDESGIDMDYKEIEYFQKLYDGDYFETITNHGQVKISLKGKQIIDNYGSLSQYLIAKSQENKKATNKRTAIKIIPILIMLASLVVAVSTEYRNSKLSNKNIELIDSVNHKDSLLKNADEIIKSKNAMIFELNEMINKKDSI